MKAKPKLASFGYDLTIWHQDCPWFDTAEGQRSDASPRFLPQALAHHDVADHVKRRRTDREDEGISLFCERCPAWIHIGIHPARPTTKSL